MSRKAEKIKIRAMELALSWAVDSGEKDIDVIMAAAEKISHFLSPPILPVSENKPVSKIPSSVGAIYV